MWKVLNKKGRNYEVSTKNLELTILKEKFRFKEEEIGIKAEEIRI